MSPRMTAGTAAETTGPTPGPTHGDPAETDGAMTAPVNEVRLIGRVSGDPEERTLPSGDVVWTLRLVVSRPIEKPRTGPARSKQTVDTVDCAVWRGRVRRSVATWRPGDVVEVVGSIRRRFYRGAGGVASRVEIEVMGGRMVRRAGTS